MPDYGQEHDNREHNRGQEDRSEGKFNPPPGILDPSGADHYKEGWNNTNDQIKDSK
jgi:hypothetical protein